MQQKEPKNRILRGLSLSVSMALLYSAYAHAASADNPDNVASPQNLASATSVAAQQKPQKSSSKYKKHSRHTHSISRKTASTGHLPEEYSESFRVSAQLPPNYLKNNGDVDYAVKLANYIDYAADGRPIPVGHASYQPAQSTINSQPHKAPAEQVNLTINGPHLAKYEPAHGQQPAAISTPQTTQQMVNATVPVPATIHAMQPASPIQQSSAVVASSNKSVSYGTGSIKFLDDPNTTAQHYAAQDAPLPVRKVLKQPPVRIAHAAPSKHKPATVQLTTTAPIAYPASIPVAEPQQVALNVSPQTHANPESIPVSPANRVDANAVITEPVDRKNQLASNIPNQQPVSSSLPWLTQAKTKPALTVAAAEPVVQSVKIVPLKDTTTSILPSIDDPNVAPHLIPPTIPPAVPAPMVPFPQHDLTAESSVPGISQQSQNVVNSLPPEKIPHRARPEPVDISHERKNQFEQYMEEKSHTGEGIKISIRQPKENVEKMLEAAYDDLIGGDQESAINLYREVLVMEPENKLALFGLATTYHRAGQIQLARPLYAKLLEIDPYNVEGLNNFLVLLADESPKGALEELDKLEKSHPGFSPIPAQMAIIYEKMGDYDMAARKMDAAINLSPENLKYRYDMAIILDKKGDWTDAAVLYKELLVASDRGEKIAANPEEIQQRLTFILSNRPRG